jgi:hypothetical protein
MNKRLEAVVSDIDVTFDGYRQGIAYIMKTVDQRELPRDLCERRLIYAAGIRSPCRLIVGQKHLRRWAPLTRIHVKRAAEQLLLAAEGGIEAWRIDTHRRDQLAEGCAHTQVYADGRSSLTQCFSASESGSGGFIPWMVQKSIGVWSMWTSQR